LELADGAQPVGLPQRLENVGFQWENVGKLGEEPWINDGKLAGGLEHGWIMTFHILGIVTPTDGLIFFRGVETTNQMDK